MSMTIAQQSPAMSWSFDEDAGNGKLVSMTGLSGSSFGGYAPGVVELNSSSYDTKGGIRRMNIAVRVPIPKFSVDGQNAVTGKDFIQTSLTVTCPNKAGIVGSTNATSGVPGDQIAANLAAVNEGLSLLANLISSQKAGTLASGKALFEPANTTGAFDSSNPIARGLAGIIPVDPNANRAIPQVV